MPTPLEKVEDMIHIYKACQSAHYGGERVILKDIVTELKDLRDVIKNDMEGAE
ncbi:hypothetical protein MOE86_15590 [Bacillus atrophaeus]|uniref:hypothetical protein n=1 Tax=Bacillus atrophaeus TaxID=1452 RepID=UPI0022824783|nr:hypothetical protein [Bacillus atrophaeus]MCY9198101.1 hypothetical protein [Bacillus atrophaeus]